MQPTNNEQSGATSSSTASSSEPQQSGSSWNARTWSPSSSFQPRPFQPRPFQPRPFQPTSFRPTSYTSASTSPSPVVNGQSNFQSPPPALNPSCLASVFHETAIQAPSRDCQKLVMQSLKKGTLSIKEEREMLEKIKASSAEQLTQTMAWRKQIDENITSFYDESMKMNKLYSSLAFKIANALKDATIASIRTGEALQMDYLELTQEEFKNYKEIMLAAVKQNGLALQFASRELKEDKEVVLAAVKQNGLALQFASQELKENKEVVLAAVKQNGLALQFVSEELKNGKDIVLAAGQEDC
ncbi:DUF4116 domain-containing protein [Neochlamydia sp. EPS4]|uniref:DUF4116 domain-containing protein n=1 Tax=Neochlamydia sp. EPS4 TaxID=1478175 RepID=UPI0005D1077C|nr:DUF4116 domain-containing protein [Neochlamydia sp. EPS4]